MARSNHNNQEEATTAFLAGSKAFGKSMVFNDDGTKLLIIDCAQ
jgi:hypothetical protein